MTWTRRAGGMVDQARRAAWAVAIACSTSLFEANGTFAVTWPVAGSRISPNRPLLPSTLRPPMK